MDGDALAVRGECQPGAPWPVFIDCGQGKDRNLLACRDLPDLCVCRNQLAIGREHNSIDSARVLKSSDFTGRAVIGFWPVLCRMDAKASQNQNTGGETNGFHDATPTAHSITNVC